MKRRPFLVITLTASLLTSTLGQTKPEPNSQQGTPSADEVVRVDTNLVQVDAVVTDSSGRQVTDLRPEDFEILEDGRPQQITAFTYVSTEGATGAPEPTRTPALPVVKNAPPVPARPLSREQVRRTIVAVVDDMGLSFQSMDTVRRALKKFVDDDMQPGDLVAIVRTSGGTSDLWRMTSDKQLLYAAIKRLRWLNFGNRVGLYALPPIANGVVAGSAIAPSLLADSTHSLEYIVAALKPLPGRKSVLLFTDSFPILEKTTSLEETSDTTPPASGLTGRDSDYAMDLGARLVQASNQASVVIYGIDPRGLATTSPTAADDSPQSGPADITGKLRPGVLQPSGAMVQLSSGEWLTRVLSTRGAALLATQDGLKYLSRQTGGFAITNTNDIGEGIGRIANDLRGYYLVGYRPSDGTFQKKNGRVNYHEIKLLVKRPGLHVRSRAGFFGIPLEKPTEVVPRTMEEQLIASINSPFTASDVRLRLTALFGNATPGSFVRVLIHVEAHDLTFKEKPDGWHETVMDVLASSYSDKGGITDHIARTDTVRARGNAYARLQRNGLDYDLLVPVKKPGAYQLRAAVRDAATGRVGTVNRFIEVPDVKKAQMTLSGISLSDRVMPINLASVFWTTASQPVASLKISQGAATDEDSEVQPTSAVRRFGRGMLLEYVYTIYNARADRSNALPELSAEVRLFRDSQLVMSKEESPLDTSVLQFDPKRLKAKGALALGDELQPGEYVLQVIVTDQTAKSKTEAATQWIDFEIVK